MRAGAGECQAEYNEKPSLTTHVAKMVDGG